MARNESEPARAPKKRLTMVEGVGTTPCSYDADSRETGIANSYSESKNRFTMCEWESRGGTMGSVFGSKKGKGSDAARGSPHTDGRFGRESTTDRRDYAEQN